MGRGRSAQLTAVLTERIIRCVLGRYLDYLRQPKQLVALPFRIMSITVALYLLGSGSPWYSERTHVLTLAMVAMVAATFLIDAVWWATHRHRADSSG